MVKNKIREIRARHHLTQDDLAERLEVSRQTIISLEKERYNPSIILAFKLARVFSCQIEDIFIYEED
jgi:putative transcriptional regulator